MGSLLLLGTCSEWLCVVVVDLWCASVTLHSLCCTSLLCFWSSATQNFLTAMVFSDNFSPLYRWTLVNPLCQIIIQLIFVFTYIRVKCTSNVHSFDFCLSCPHLISPFSHTAHQQSEQFSKAKGKNEDDNDSKHFSYNDFQFDSVSSFFNTVKNKQDVFYWFEKRMTTHQRRKMMIRDKWGRQRRGKSKRNILSSGKKFSFNLSELQSGTEMLRLSSALIIPTSVISASHIKINCGSIGLDWTCVTCSHCVRCRCRRWISPHKNRFHQYHRKQKGHK